MKKPLRLALVGVAAVLLAGIVAFVLLTRREELSGAMTIRIWDAQRRGDPLTSDPAAAPLRANDLFRVEVELSRPAFVYLVWIGSEGKATPMSPWEGTWTARPSVEEPVARLSLPDAADTGLHIPPGAPGFETIVLLAREDPLPPEVRLEDLLADLPGLQLENPEGVFVFENWAATSRVRGILRTIQDPILRTYGVLKARLSQHFEFSCSVSFASLGE